MQLEINEDEYDIICLALEALMRMADAGYAEISEGGKVNVTSLVYKMAMVKGLEDVAEDAVELAKEYNIPFTPA